MTKEEFDSAVININNSFALSKEKIGATSILWQLPKLLPPRLAAISMRFEEGKPISSIEIQELRVNWQSEDPLIDENGNPFVFYIHDFSNSHWGAPNRVFHVAWCHTLEKMEKGGRKERYVKKTDLGNNDFRVDYGNGRKGVERLPACYNCETKMQNKVSPQKLYYDRNKLDIDKFFQMYGKQDLINMNNPMHPVGYPENWDQISRRMRENANWVCGNCHKDFSRDRGNLDVHHKNGIRSDARADNLVVLCKRCHSEQFAHGHYKNSPNFNSHQNLIQKKDGVLTGVASQSQMNKLENFLNQPERYATGSEKAIQKVREVRDSFESIKGGLTKEKQAEFYRALSLYESKLKDLKVASR